MNDFLNLGKSLTEAANSVFVNAQQSKSSSTDLLSGKNILLL